MSLLGSYVNIPIAELPAEHVLSNQEIPYYGNEFARSKCAQRRGDENHLVQANTNRVAYIASDYVEQ
jgi:hypothetical protein